MQLTSTCWLCGETTSKQAVHLKPSERLTCVLSENFESNALGIIDPNKCAYVKLLNRVIEYKPCVFQWHTDGKHARAMIELMGLDGTTQQASANSWEQVQPGKSDSAGGQPESAGGQLRNAEDELDGEDRRAYHSGAGTPPPLIGQTRHLVFYGSLMSGHSCPTMKHLALLKHIARYLVGKQECAWQFPEQQPPMKIVAFPHAD